MVTTNKSDTYEYKPAEFGKRVLVHPNERKNQCCSPVRPVPALTREAQIEERGRHEGEEGDGGAAYEVEQRAEVRQRLSDEEREEHEEGPQSAPPPPEPCRERR